jgi:hypothetical protein
MPGRLRRRADVKVSYSSGGRQWPEKAWDADYVSALANTEFVLCPNGDFIWTYRFFEAAAAGAIPVIEDYCDHYEGFVFRSFDEAASTFRWSEEAARHNAALVRERLSVPPDELASAVTDQIRRSIDRS